MVPAEGSWAVWLHVQTSPGLLWRAGCWIEDGSATLHADKTGNINTISRSVAGGVSELKSAYVAANKLPQIRLMELDAHAVKTNYKLLIQLAELLESTKPYSLVTIRLWEESEFREMISCVKRLFDDSP